MAFERFTYDPDEEEKRLRLQNSPALAYQSVSGAATTGALPAPSQGAPGSRFVGFDRYLSANQDGRQAMAGALAGGVEKKGKEAQDAFGKVQDKFNQSTTVKPYGNETVVTAPNPANGYATAPAAGQGVTQGTAARAPVVTPAGAITRDELARRVGSTYGGPSSLAGVEGYGAAVGLGQAAASAAGRLGTPEGVQASLGDLYGQRGGYSQGLSQFDAALTGAGNGARFAELGKRFGALPQQFTDATAASAGQSAAARRDFDVNTGRARDLLTGHDTAQAAGAEKQRQTAAEQERLAPISKRRALFNADDTQMPWMAEAGDLSRVLNDSDWGALEEAMRRSYRSRTGLSGRADEGLRAEVAELIRSLRSKYGLPAAAAGDQWGSSSNYSGY